MQTAPHKDSKTGAHISAARTEPSLDAAPASSAALLDGCELWAAVGWGGAVGWISEGKADRCQ